MSNKSLLEEGTVRRFMKLAGTDILSSEFLTETKEEEDCPEEEGKKTIKKGDKITTGKTKGQLADEDPSEGEETETGKKAYAEARSRRLQEQEGIEDVADIEGDLEDEEVEDVDIEDLPEPGAELEVDEEEPEEEEPEAEELVRRMVDAIAGVAEEFGVEVEVSEEPPETELEVPEFGAEEGEEGEFEADADEDIEAADVDLDAAEDEEGLKGLEEVNYIDEDLILHEVFHRVKNRLIQEKRADKLAAKLANKISRRLSKRSRR